LERGAKSRSILVVLEKATAWRHRPQWPLKEQCIAQASADFVIQDFWVMASLRLPEALEFLGNHISLQIENVLAIAGPSRTHRKPLLVLLPEILPHRTALGVVDTLPQRGDRALNLPGFLFGLRIAGVLAAALEAALACEMKQSPAKLMRRQALVEAAGTELIGINGLQELAIVRVGWHQSSFHQIVHESAAALKYPIAASARLPCQSAIGSQ
jgi:hypothetical protein